MKRGAKRKKVVSKKSLPKFHIIDIYLKTIVGINLLGFILITLYFFSWTTDIRDSLAKFDQLFGVIWFAFNIFLLYYFKKSKCVKHFKIIYAFPIYFISVYAIFAIGVFLQFKYDRLFDMFFYLTTIFILSIFEIIFAFNLLNLHQKALRK